jgi:hypothetical protein
MCRGLLAALVAALGFAFAAEPAAAHTLALKDGRQAIHRFLKSPPRGQAPWTAYALRSCRRVSIHRVRCTVHRQVSSRPSVVCRFTAEAFYASHKTRRAQARLVGRGSCR